MLDFTMNESSLKIIKNKEDQYNLPYLWIRDNCSCDQCRVKETQEKSIKVLKKRRLNEWLKDADVEISRQEKIRKKLKY